MRTLRIAVVAVAVAVVLLLAATHARARDNGTYLHTGDVFCTDQTLTAPHRPNPGC